jgi:hypothetical protein
MRYRKYYDVLLGDRNSTLSQQEYGHLRRFLASYKELQGHYAVKQNDIERARRAAEVCGLEMLRPKPRKSTENCEIK